MNEQTSPQAPAAKSGVAAVASQINLADMLWAGRTRLLLALALSLLFAGIWLSLATPVYQADALLHVDQEQAAMTSLDEMSEIFRGEASEAQTDIQLLRSRSLMKQVIEAQQLDLTIQPKYAPVIGAAMARRWQGDGLAAALFGLKQYAWGGEQLQVTELKSDSNSAFTLQVTALSGDRFKVEGNALRQSTKGELGKPLTLPMLNGDAEITIGDIQARSGVIFSLRYQPVLVATQALKRRLKISEQGRGTGILELELRSQNPQEAAATLNSLMDNYLRENVQLRTEQAERSLAFVEEQLPQIRQATEAAEAQLNQYRLENQAIDFTLESRKLLERLVSVEQEIARIDLQRSELITEYTERHPLVENASRQREKVLQQRNELDSQLKSLPQTQQDMLRLSRDVEVNASLYTLLLNKSQELRIMRAGTLGNVRIVDRAEVPMRAAEPKPALILIVAAAIGLLLGLLWVLRHEMTRRGIEDPRQLEEDCGLSVYAVVPHSPVQQKLTKAADKRGQAMPLLVNRDDGDMAAEALRSLHTAMHFLLKSDTGQSLLITGPTPNVGKTFISVNIAHLLAAGGRKVLLVDADMRRGHVHRYLGERREGGLSDVLVGDVDADAAIRVLSPQLHCITAGKPPPNAAALLLDDAWNAFLTEMRSRYDLVLIDSPPILPVSDPLILGATADAALLVVKAENTALDEVDECQRRFARSGLTLTGAIVNDAPLASGPARYRYGYYRYQYQYA